MIRGAKTIAEYKVKKWIQTEMPDVRIESIEVSGNEFTIRDIVGDQMTIVYDEFSRSVHEK